MSDATTRLVSSSQIAEMADRSPAAVSNWRSRLGDFPRPCAGTSGRPLFDLDEVTAWLRKRGIEPRLSDAKASLWEAMDRLRGQATIEEAARLIVEAAAMKKIGRTVGESHLAHSRPELWAQVSDSLKGVDDADLAPLADEALDRSHRSLARGGGEAGYVGSQVSKLLGLLVADQESGTLYDPAIGIAAAVIDAVQSGARPDRIVGHEISREALELARWRGALADIDLELYLADVLASDPDSSLEADRIVLEPPLGMRFDGSNSLMDRRFAFGPPPRSAEMAWLQHAIAHLSTSGRAYVTTTPGALTAISQGAVETRRDMLLAGCVKSIVGLPGGMLTNTSIPLALWELSAPSEGDHNRRVLLVDASELDSPEEHVARWLAEPDRIPSSICARIPVEELLEADANLSPKRWVAEEALGREDHGSRFREAEARLGTAVTDLAGSAFEAGREWIFDEMRIFTVGELAKQGVLENVRGRRWTEDDREWPSVIGHRQVRDGVLPPGGGTGELTKQTKPGDVLVTTMHEIRVLVDSVGGHYPALDIHRLRVLDTAQLIPEYLAACLDGSWNARFQAGTTIRRANIRDLEVPLVPVEDQRAVVAYVADANRAVDRAQEVRRAAQDAVTALMNSIRFVEKTDKHKEGSN